MTVIRRFLAGTTLVSALAAAAAVLAAPATGAAAPHFTGVVVSPTGVPVPNVFVSSYADDGNAGRTDANGRFDFPNAGDLTVPQLFCGRLAQDAPQGGAAGWYDVCQDVTAGTDATLRFQPGAAIGGTVLDVRSGRALAGASVSVFDNNDSAGYSVTTDANGRWTYRNLRPGRLNLVPSSAQKVTAAAPRGYDAVGADHAPIVLRGGQARSDLTISIAPVVQYSGTVLDGSGAPVGGAKVAVATYDAFAGTTTAADGTWNVLRPWSGVADVCTWAGASTAHPTGLAVTCRTVSAAGLNVGATLRLTAVGGALAGSVQVPDGGTPTVTVDVPLTDGAQLTLTAVKRGSTYTVSGLPRGSYRATASARIPTVGTAVAASRPRAVVPGATTMFPKIVLATGGA